MLVACATVAQFQAASAGPYTVLTVIVANGSKALCHDVHTLDWTFTAEGGDRKVTVSSQQYALNGLHSDVILGMGFLKWYNPSISWIDYHVGMPCLTANGGVCQSSRNDVAKAVVCSDCHGMSKCSNGPVYTGRLIKR